MSAIVTEPTDLRLAIGHKGFAWVEVVTRTAGRRMAAGRTTAATRSPAWAACWCALEARDRELRARRRVAFQGTGSLHASIISGGRELSSYPDRCTLQMERRTVSGEDEAVVTAEIARRCSSDLRTDDPEFASEARVDGISPRLRTRGDARAAQPRSAARSARRAWARRPPACRSGPTPRFSPAPASPRSCSVPAAPVSTAPRST